MTPIQAYFCRTTTLQYIRKNSPTCPDRSVDRRYMQRSLLVLILSFGRVRLWTALPTSGCAKWSSIASTTSSQNVENASLKRGAGAVPPSPKGQTATSTPPTRSAGKRWNNGAFGAYEMPPLDTKISTQADFPRGSGEDHRGGNLRPERGRRSAQYHCRR